MECYMGMIMLFAFEWAPRDFALCNGAVIPIQQSTALYSLIGTAFGGDGRSTFGLPDLRDRVPAGMQIGKRVFGQKFGSEGWALVVNELPAHQHAIQEVQAGKTVTVNAKNAQANKLPPTGNFWARGYTGAAATQNYADSPDTTMNSDAVQLNIGNLTTTPTGGSQPISLMQPSMALNYSICTLGLFPERP